MRKSVLVLLVLLLAFSALVLTACKEDEVIVKITFDPKGGTPIPDLEKLIGEDFELPTPPPREGYTFRGWYADEALTNPFTLDKMPEESITVYAKWDVNSYTLTFDTRGGNAIAPLSVNYGDTIAAPAESPSRTGYTFLGWYADEELTTAFQFSTMPARNLTAYADWSIIKLTYNFLDEGGSVVLKSDTVDYGSEIVAPTVMPTKPATAQYTYTFAGWDKAIPAAITDNINFTATYTKTVNKYTYTFYDEDGTELKKATVDYGDPIVAPETNPTKPATVQYTYTFAGWDKDVPATVTGNITFTAQFTATLNKYTYTFYDEDGTTVIESKTVDYGSAITEPDITPTKPATVQYTYTFAGWDKDVPATVTGNITFTAQFTATLNKYTYTFYNEDGVTELKRTTADYGSEIAEPAETPTKPATAEYSYTFAGWDKAVPAALTGDIFFRAVFTKTNNEYNVSFDSRGGDDIASVKVAYGSAVPEPKEPARDYFTFEGWYIEGTGEEFDFSSMPARDVDLYAVWTVEDGYCEVIVIGGQGSGVYPENSFIVITPDFVPGMDLVCWKINGEIYTSNFNFYYTVTGNLLIEAVFEESPYNMIPAVAAGESPLTGLSYLPNGYPLEVSRIQPGYDKLYIGHAGDISWGYEVFAAYAIYPDGTYIFEKFDYEEKYFDCLWGEVSGDNHSIIGAADLFADGSYYIYTWVIGDWFYFENRFGTILYSTEYLISLGDWIFIDIDILREELPKEGALLGLAPLDEILYCPVGQDITYFDGSIGAVEYRLTDDPFSGHSSVPFINGLYVSDYNYLYAEEEDIEGFDSSEPGEKTLTYFGLEVTIIFYEGEDVKMEYGYRIYYNDYDTLIFILGEGFDADKFFDYGFYINCNNGWTWIEEPITEDMLTGFSTDTAGQFEFTLTFMGRSKKFTYHVVPEDADDNDIIGINMGQIWVMPDGSYEGYIEFYLANGYIGCVSSFPGDSYHYDYFFTLSEALEDQTLQINIPDNRIAGYMLTTATYRGVSGNIYIYFIDPENLQITDIYATDNDDYKIYIKTDGTIFVAGFLENHAYFDNFDSFDFTDSENLKYLVGLDLTSPGRQLVKLYTINDYVYSFYVIVYEGEELPPPGYKIDLPRYVPLGGQLPGGTISYYYDRDFYEDDTPAYVDDIVSYSGLDTSVRGWQTVMVYIERLNFYAEYPVYVFDYNTDHLKYEFQTLPRKVSQSASIDDIREQITILVTLFDGQKIVLKASEISGDFIKLNFEGDVWRVQLNINPLTPEGEDPEREEALVNIIYSYMEDGQFSFALEEDIYGNDVYRVVGYNYSMAQMIDELVIPSHYEGIPVTSISPYFIGNNPIRRVVIPETITLINYSTFSSLDSLREVIFLGEEAPYIREEAFEYLDSVKFFVPDDSLEDYKAALPGYEDRVYKMSDWDEVMIINGVLVGYHRIERHITLPAGITGIADGVFAHDDQIRSIYIPNTVKFIGDLAFYKAENLGTVTLEAGSVLETIGEYAFYQTSIGEFAFPSSLKEIGEGAFQSIYSLSAAHLGENIRYIGDSAFYDCSNLGDVSLLATPEFIGGSVFDYTGYYYLQPAGATYLGNWLVFYKYKPGEETLELPIGTCGVTTDAFPYFGNDIHHIVVNAHIKYVGASFFLPNLETVTFLGEEPPEFHIQAFLNNFTNKKIYVPVGCVEAYTEATAHTGIPSDVEILEIESKD